MGALDPYRTRGAYPDFDKPKPKKRYCLRGETLAKTVALRNMSDSEQELFSIIVVANNSNSQFGAIDINVTAGPSQTPLDGTPIPDSKITTFTPGLIAEVNEDVTVPGDVPPLSEYGRLYVPANGGEAQLLIGQGALPTGATIYAEFTGLLNITDYTIIFELEAAETL